MKAPKKRLAMHWQILLALFLAVPTIALLKALQTHAPDWGGTSFLISSVGVVGKLFLKLLKMIIMPLVIASVVMSVAGFNNIGRLRRLGLKAMLYYGFTTMVAVFLGVVFVNLFEPGVGFSLSSAAPPDESKRKGIEEIILALVSDNIFGSLANNSAILSGIVFALLLGVGIAAVGEKAAPLRRFFEALNAVMMKVTEWVMMLAPIGVWALVVRAIMPVGWGAVSPLFKYVMTVIVALAVHGMVVLPLLYAIITRRSPLTYARAMNASLLTAFSTSSSAATLPITMRCAEKRGGVSPRASRFILPLGATVNMDGTALYESVAAIFIAQAYGIYLGLGAQTIVFATATLAAIGAAGVPSAGLVTLLVVLEAVNLPAEGYGLIVVVDRLLDMCRTTVNVWGDACGAAFLAHTEGELAPEDLTADAMSDAGVVSDANVIEA